MHALAVEMQDLTKYSNEQVEAAQAILLSFTNITDDVFPRTARVAADVAERMEMDLNSTLIQLAKALNDPIANLGALSRAGIQFSKDQKAVIAQLVGTNRLADAQRMILEELERQYGGSAAAARDTFGGSLAFVRNQFGELAEFIGNRYAGSMRTAMEVTGRTVKILIGAEVAADEYTAAAQRAADVTRILAKTLVLIVAVKAARAFWDIVLAIEAGVVAAPALAASLFPVLAVVAAIGTAVAALEFGRYLYDEFKVVQLTLQTSIMAFQDLYTYVETGGKAAFEVLAGAWRAMAHTALTVTAGMLKQVEKVFKQMTSIYNEFTKKFRGNVIGRGMLATAGLPTGELEFGGLDKIIKGLETSAAGYAAGGSTGDALAGVWSEHEAARKRIAEQDAAIRRQIEADFAGGDRKGGSFTDFLTKDIGTVISGLDQVYDEFLGTAEAAQIMQVRSRDAMNAIDDGADRASASVRRLTEEQLERLQTVAEGVGDAFGHAFESIIFDAKSAREAVEDLVRSITRLVFQQVVTQTISRAISGAIMRPAAAGAYGLVLDAGNVVPFAAGGIVSGPTRFPMSGGRTGLMGENGPEAVMPLERGPDGKLGVQGGGQTIVKMTVNTPDADSFRRSQTQIMRELRRRLGM